MQRTINSNLPRFDGTGSVGGFLRVFEQMQEMYGASERQMIGALLTCLKGSALSWLQDHPTSFGESYGALKAALVAEFGGELAS